MYKVNEVRKINKKRKEVGVKDREKTKQYRKKKMKKKEEDLQSPYFFFQMGNILKF